MSIRPLITHGVFIPFITVLVVLAAAETVILINRYSYLMEDVDRPLVCAHRGDNVNAPENTMPAFELAASENLRWIELDVHQTSDGVIVCNHDSNLQRTTGVNMSIHDHTFEELTACEFGSWMPGNYEHVTVPSLKEALTFAYENGLYVQVELKGHPDDVDYTDNISVEESNITPELVRQMHARGKKVFCWTVDLDDTVQYLVSCDVDVIGTDDPLLISNAVEKADCSGGISRVFHIFMHIIADMDK